MYSLSKTASMLAALLSELGCCKSLSPEPSLQYRFRLRYAVGAGLKPCCQRLPNGGGYMSQNLPLRPGCQTGEQPPTTSWSQSELLYHLHHRYDVLRTEATGIVIQK